MTYTIEEVAKVAHEAYRALGEIQGTDDNPYLWENAPEFEKRFVIQNVELAIKYPEDTPEGFHERLCESKASEGWTLGAMDYDTKTCPDLIPYEDLSPQAQRRFEVFRAIVKILTTK